MIRSRIERAAAKAIADVIGALEPFDDKRLAAACASIDRVIALIDKLRPSPYDNDGDDDADLDPLLEHFVALRTVVGDLRRALLEEQHA